MTFNEHQLLAIQTEAPITPELRERYTLASPLLLTMMVDGMYWDLADQVKRYIYYGSKPSKNLLELMAAETVENKDFRFPPQSDREIRLVHGWLGMLSEIPEMAMAIIHQDQKNIGEESGDWKWYGSIIDDANGIPAGKVARANILKLAGRYPDKFTMQSALIRDLKAEDEVLSDALLTE